MMVDITGALAADAIPAGDYYSSASLQGELFSDPRGLKDELSLLTSPVKLFFDPRIVNTKAYFFSGICSILEQGVNLSNVVATPLWYKKDKSRVASITG